MGILDFDMETDAGTARDSLINSLAGLSVSGVHEGSSPWLMLSSAIAALEALITNGGASAVPKYRSVSLPIVAAATAQDTTLIIPDGAIILPGSFISGGDEDGFIDGLSVAAAGSILPTLADGAATVGVLNSVDESAGDLVPEGYACTAATTICYTLGSDDFAELVAEVFIPVLEP
jgi:hypothetical protein